MNAKPHAQTKLFDNPVEKKPHYMFLGTHRIYRYENGYGASVVRFLLCPADSSINKFSIGGYGSYTSNEDEWELCVIRFVGEANEQYILDDTTPVAKEVLGHLLEKEVEEILHQIKDLKPSQPQEK